MKTQLAVLSALLVLTCTACHSITVTLSDGTVAKVSSFGQKTTIGGLRYSTNGVTLTNYNNDQVSALQAAFAAGLAAAKAGAIP
jgi:hypothetical protein